MPNDPTWLLTFAQAAFATLALVGLGAAIGYCLGIQRRFSPVIAVAPRRADWTIELETCRSSGLSVADKIRALTQLTFECRQSLSPALLQAIDELVDASQLLHRQLEQLAHAKTTHAISTTDNDQIAHSSVAGPTSWTGEGGSPSSHSDLSGDEVQSLRASVGEPSSKSRISGRDCHKYDHWQKIYPCRDVDGAASIAPAVAVRCREIGTKSVSFFIVDCPDFCQLIIALGNDANPVFMAAEIENSKAVSMYGEVGYLVACRFVARLPEFSEQSRVQFNKRRNWDIARLDQTVSDWSQNAANQAAQVPAELIA